MALNEDNISSTSFAQGPPIARRLPLFSLAYFATSALSPLFLLTTPILQSLRSRPEHNPAAHKTASLLSSDHAEERRKQEISKFSFSAHHRSVTTTFSYVLHGGYRYKKYGVLAMA
jgi:hypothetical protein